MNIFLIRHGESQSNTGEIKPCHKMPDHKIRLTFNGAEQSVALGKRLASLKETSDQHYPCLSLSGNQKLGVQISDIMNSDLALYHSPFIRAKQTLAHLLHSAGNFTGLSRISDTSPVLDQDLGFIDQYSTEDARLREIDFGPQTSQMSLREIREYGQFYYAYPNGESQAQVYDRVCSFYEDTIKPDIDNNKDVMIISHGLAIKALIMRIMRFTVDEFATIRTPKNSSLITISTDLESAATVCFKTNLAIDGIEFRP